MILRPTESFQLLITQPDHAALAARIMQEWSADGLPASPRRALILLAVEEHDNGWREVDASPLIDAATGRILDFITVADEVKRGVWPRALARLAHAPYAAALVAEHALHVYRRYRPQPDWARHFEEMEDARARHLAAASPLTLDDLLRDYFFLRIGDLASLTFCNGWTEVQTDDLGYGYSIRLEEARLVVSPDPFAGRTIPIEVTARPSGGGEPITVEGVASGR